MQPLREQPGDQRIAGIGVRSRQGDDACALRVGGVAHPFEQRMQVGRDGAGRGRDHHSAPSKATSEISGMTSRTPSMKIFQSLCAMFGT